jgi:catalase
MSITPSLVSKSIHEQIVEVQRALAGPHAGYRPVHAKGIVCSGSFRASAEARRVSRAVHLQGQPHLVVVRFSNASGDPNVHDGLRNVRALSVKFQLPGGGSADLLANSIEGFPARTPEEFLAFLQAQLPGPNNGKPARDRLASFQESHPATKAFVEHLSKKPVPVSYAQASYHAVHAFRFTAADGTSRFGRYSWIPDAGEAYLSPDEGVKKSRNFLREELDGRLLGGPLFFGLALQLALESDPTDDATALWPADRPVVALGRLEITGISPTSKGDERALVFDPANRTNGIDLSADPILLARSAAYSISFDRRTKGI